MAIKKITVVVIAFFLFSLVGEAYAGRRHRRGREGDRTAAFAVIGSVLTLGLIFGYLHNSKREETERKAIDREYDMQGKQAELNAALQAPGALGDNRETSTVDQTTPGRTVLHAPLIRTHLSPRREMGAPREKYMPDVPPPPSSTSLEPSPREGLEPEFVQVARERRQKPPIPNIEALRQLRSKLPLTAEFRNARLALSMGIEEVKDPWRAAYNKDELRAVVEGLNELQQHRRSHSLDALVAYLSWAVR